jgi:two-component system NarL family response regulator
MSYPQIPAACLGLTPPRIVVADDHPVVRSGLLALLAAHGIPVVGQAATAEEAVELILLRRPDVAMLDLRMPQRGGLWALAQVRDEWPQMRAIIFTALDGDESIRRALEAGARGYLLKTASPDAIVGAIRTVHAGLRSIPETIAARLAEHVGRPDLSRRELQVLRLLALGRTNREVGLDLGITEGTVKLHVSRVLAKLCVRDRTEAVTTAIRRGIVQLWRLESPPDAAAG